MLNAASGSGSAAVMSRGSLSWHTTSMAKLPGCGEAGWESLYRQLIAY
jgi:hypothetical protein